LLCDICDPMWKSINIPAVIKILSRNLFILSGAMCICTLVSFIYSENSWPFIISALAALFSGYVLHLLTRGYTLNGSLLQREAYLTVTLSWLFISIFGSLPYLLSGAIPSVINALFESVSGFTTTGSSILEDIESLPKSILFWRSLTHWIGGIGIIILVIIVMPSLQIGGYHLFSRESSLQEKIMPKVSAMGKQLLVIYLLLTCIQTLLLVLGGMNWFESICHAFGTVATGGFSPKNDSIAGYSPYIQYVVMLFMVLSGSNFIIHYYLIRREFKKAGTNEEFRFFLMIIFILGAAMTGILFFNLNKPFEIALRESFFQVITILTTTGYATADYLAWPEYAWIILFFAMFLGGSTGSTSGGIKMARHLVVLKNFTRVFRQLLSPFAVLSIRLNEKPIHDHENNTILAFVCMYILVFIVGCVFMMAIGLDGKTAAGSVATCMAGIGPGIGTVGPAGNFAHLPDLAKLILSFLMLLGRLEIYTVVILFSRSFWRV
jgi:trk system potassium uptake protein